MKWICFTMLCVTFLLVGCLKCRCAWNISYIVTSVRGARGSRSDVPALRTTLSPDLSTAHDDLQLALSVPWTLPNAISDIYLKKMYVLSGLTWEQILYTILISTLKMETVGSFIQHYPTPLNMHSGTCQKTVLRCLETQVLRCFLSVLDKCSLESR